MRKLMMMLGVLLAMPLLAADTPATLDTLRDQIATLTTTVNAMKQKLDGLRLGGAVGDIGSLKDTVTNQGMQIVTATGGYSFTSQESAYPHWTTWSYSAPTYTDQGGNIPGVVVHASNGITLPAGTYLFRQVVPDDFSSSLEANIRGRGQWSYQKHSWWRWTGDAGHATERVDGDVVWPMIRPGIFTFASPKIIKIYRPNVKVKSPCGNQDQIAAEGGCYRNGKFVLPQPQTTNPPLPNDKFTGIIERL